MVRMEDVPAIVDRVIKKNQQLPATVDELTAAERERFEAAARAEGITPQQALDAARAVIADKQNGGEFDPAAIAAAARANR
ncbi:hypothetical protein ABIB48_002657 [Arthrobacter sp. UYCu511]|uniref:hypothetical protein n=1 Tax=Arthrobacter sp. UYCu511 TaxID=3156337 RepID=UPI0033929DF9